MREKFRYEYGAGPAHLVAGVLAIGSGVWALVTVLGLVGRPFNVARWFAGSIVVHDLIALPIYSAIGVIAATVILRRKPTPIRLAALNHVRVPAMFSAVALLVWFPLILNKAPVTFARATGYRPDFYMGRWLTFTAVLFAVSAIIFCMRLPRLRASR